MPLSQSNWESLVFGTGHPKCFFYFSPELPENQDNCGKSGDFMRCKPNTGVETTSAA